MTEQSEKPARIFLIDDHPIVRQGLLQLFLESPHTICGEAGSRAEAQERIGPSRADLAILDLSLGEESGLEIIASLRRKGIRVLVYSMHEDADTIERAFDAEADGYVSKRETEEILFQAIAEIMDGQRYLSPVAAHRVADRVLSKAPDNPESLLSEREQTVLTMLGRGASYTDIAEALFISVRTVETYFTRIIAKLRLDGMKELRRYAIRKTSL